MKPLNSRDERVLIVGDNPLVLEAVEKAGRQFRMESDLATDGWAAIEMLRTERYAAIVIDTDLPRHSGFGVLTYLRQENGDQLANVILMTSADRDDVRRRVSEDRLQVIRKTEAVDEIAAAMSCFVSQE
jgi:DNA-binding response OmpR family regulator